MKNYIKDFSELNKSNADIAGGKGASLGEMMQAGIPVPDGFVVLSTTFDHFLHETDLTQEIDSILTTVDHKEMHTVEGASEKIQGLIKNVQMPKSIAEEIKNQFKVLDTEYVAVRSSATAEDGQEHAWAGQLDSYLNITKENVLEKVQHCWASLFTPRAIFYRFEKGLNTTKISVAVVVQKMINSEKSGIAFSVHPVTEDRNQLIIEAGLGLGEAIVSGQITPDSYVVEKEPRNILDVNVSEQSRGLFRKSDGGNEWIELGEKGKKQALSEIQINELSELIIKIENHYGFPCDIEWAFESGEFYIVQSRPITTLGNEKDIPIVKKFERDIKKDSVTKLEGNYSILFAGSSLPALFSKDIVRYYDFFFKSSIFVSKNVHGAFFINLTEYEGIAKKAYQKYTTMGENSNFVKDFYKIWNKINNLYEKEQTVMKQEINANVLSDKIFNLFNLYHCVFTTTLGFESIDEQFIVNQLQKINSKRNKEEFIKMSTEIPFSSFDMRSSILLTDKKNDYNDLQFIFSDYSITPDLNMIERMVQNLIKIKGGIKKINEDITKSDKEIIETKKRINKFKDKLGSSERALFDFIQTAIYLRDIRKEPLQKIIAIISNNLRLLFNELSISEDLLIYSFIDDFKKKDSNSVEYKKILKKRKAGVILYLNKDYTEFDFDQFENYKQSIFNMIDRTHAPSSQITGAPAFPGIVKGKAQIILSSQDFKNFKKGNILVTSMTRPEFVPLMKIASGIITDEGGITCHAAIISRELKIPCVIGTKNATRFIKEDTLIELNANKGEIIILEDEPKRDMFSQVKHFLDKTQEEKFPYYLKPKETYDLKIHVNENVFSLKHFFGWKFFTPLLKVKNEDVLEIGCGSGIASLYMAKQAKKVVAVDIYKEAVQNTIENAEDNNIKNIDCRVGNVYSSIEEDEKFDTIYWNLPWGFLPVKDKAKLKEYYLAKSSFDPGYNSIKKFIIQGKNHLKKGGRILAGISSHSSNIELFEDIIKESRLKSKIIASKKYYTNNKKPKIHKNADIDYYDADELRLYELR